MTAVAKEDAPPTDLVRVYLVAVENVQKFHDLANEALGAVGGADSSEELRALWAAVNHLVATFDRSMIVKARFK